MEAAEKADLMGQRVNVRATYERRELEYQQGKGWPKVWQRCPAQQLTGWVVGFRHIQNGRSVNLGPEEGTIWEKDGPPLACLLVTTAPHRNPVRVPLDGYTLVKGE